MDLRALVRDVPDFPKPGIVFRDITPLLLRPTAVESCVARMTQVARGRGITHVAAIESRGFLFGVPIALRLGAGFVPIRKQGKLPRATRSQDYALEYGAGALEIHEDALERDDRVLLVDDVLATGGTLAAAASLVRRTGASIVGGAILIELAALRGRDSIREIDLFRVLEY